MYSSGICRYYRSMKNSYHHGDLHNELIRSGAHIIASSGRNSLTLRKVASLSGVSHASVYSHFSSKENLIQAIAAFSFSRLEELVQEAGKMYPDDPVQCLFEIAWSYVSYAYEQPDLFHCIFSGAPEREKKNPEYVERSRRAFSFIQEKVQESMVKGLCLFHDPRLGASALLSTVHGFATLNLEQMIPGSIYDGSTHREILFTILSSHFTVNIRPYL